MKEIKLTQGKIALVDDEDFERINQYKWCVKKYPKTFYAHRSGPTVNGKQKTIKMHHEIMGKPLKGFETDHINGCGFDNQKKNLRFVTRRQNTQNKQNMNKSSRFPGVCWDKWAQKWKAQIVINGKRKHLGRFIHERKAFMVYKKAVETLGETVIKID